jgi:hypothetical protein
LAGVARAGSSLPRVVAQTVPAATTAATVASANHAHRRLLGAGLVEVRAVASFVSRASSPSIDKLAPHEGHTPMKLLVGARQVGHLDATRRASHYYRAVSVFSRLLADLVVVIHLAYLVFIPVGGFLAWRWPRVIPFHLAAVAVGMVSVTVGFECPLTSWEQALRRHGGEKPYTDGFVDHYLTGKLYPHGHDALVQVLIAGAVVTAYVGLAIRHHARVSTQLTA